MRRKEGQGAEAEERGPQAWLVLAAENRGGFNETDVGPAQEWVRSHCKPQTDLHRPRLDFRREKVVIHQCPDAGPLPLAADAGRPR